MKRGRVALFFFESFCVFAFVCLALASCASLLRAARGPSDTHSLHTLEWVCSCCLVFGDLRHARTTMLGGEYLYEIEDALSVAMTASLRFPAKSRPIFIGRQLLRQNQDASLVQLTAMPARLNQEIVELQDIVAGAVNSAARYNDEPLRRIADFLLRHGGGPGSSLDAIGKAEQSLQKEELEAAAARAAEVSVQRQGQEVVGSSMENPLLRVLNLREQERRDATDGQQPMPVKLGKRPSQVMPSVIGTFQEAAARRQAREVDDDVIAQAMAAGARNQGLNAGAAKQ
jgi:hypothetical protein